MISHLHTLFGKKFDTGIFQVSCGDGFIVPLNKKENVGIVENYRGITLLSVVGKLVLLIDIFNSLLLLSLSLALSSKLPIGILLE